jgi:hypothetical protein
MDRRLLTAPIKMSKQERQKMSTQPHATASGLPRAVHIVAQHHPYITVAVGGDRHDYPAEKVAGNFSIP